MLYVLDKFYLANKRNWEEMHAKQYNKLNIASLPGEKHFLLLKHNVKQYGLRNAGNQCVTYSRKDAYVQLHLVLPIVSEHYSPSPI